MELHTELIMPEGIIQCILRRMDWYGMEVIQADMWRSEQFMEGSFTAFRAGVYLQYDGERYKLVQPSRNPYKSDFWKRMEVLLSNTIMVNE